MIKLPPGRPIPHNRTIDLSTRTDRVNRITRRLREKDLRRAQSSSGVPPIVWIVLAPVIALLIWFLLSILVGAGAAIETAISGG